jgi:hypothetical protein
VSHIRYVGLYGMEDEAPSSHGDRPARRVGRRGGARGMGRGQGRLDRRSLPPVAGPRSRASDAGRCAPTRGDRGRARPHRGKDGDRARAVRTADEGRRGRTARRSRRTRRDAVRRGRPRRRRRVRRARSSPEPWRDDAPGRRAR